jgi:hypothetical protein
MIACTLSSAEFRSRLAETRDLARRSLQSRRPVDGGEVLVFAADRDTGAALRAVIAAEAECCPFLSMNVRGGAEGLELVITGPEDARPIIAELFAR